ncbi:MAG: histidine phosphatase family protein [Actinomycetota bacterium]|nr:histidine phosphatase family protein [Actinomycetota bacterium]
MSPLDRTFLTDLPGVTTLLLIRHGQQQWPDQPDPTLADWGNGPLSDLGVRQAEAVAESLAGESIDAVYCSDLIRARDTAHQVGRHHGLVPVVVTGLREVEVFRDLPAESSIRGIMSDPVVIAAQERFVAERRWDLYPFSESSADCRHRVVGAIEEIVTAHRGRRVVVVCHSGVINAYLGHVLGLGQDMFFRPGHASVSRVLAGEGRRVLHSLNETHHLARLDPALVTA